MGDTTSILSAGEGTPQEPSATNLPKPQGSVGEPTGKQYATVEDVQRIFEDLFNRKAQSISDRTAAKVERIVAKLKEEGIQATPKQVQELLSAAQPVQPAASEARPAQAKGEGSDEQPEQVHPVLAAAIAMMERADTMIEDDDPEVKLIDTATDDEIVFLSSVRAAIQAKQERLRQTAVARAPSLGAGASGQGGGMAALVAELKQLLEHPTRNMTRIKEVQAELAKYNR